MDDASVLRGWPDGSAVIVARSAARGTDYLVHVGDAGLVRSWASVSKVAVAYAMARGVDAGVVDLESHVTDGATLAQVLSHCGGLGAERDDPRYPPGTRRVYSNVGIDLAVASVTDAPSPWLRDNVWAPLGLSSCELVGRPAAGVHGSLEDMTELALAWLRHDNLSPAVATAFTSPFAPTLAGVVPGFGRFDPCAWGLGVEVHDTKHHWMGTIASPAAFGHFGQSGTLLLIDPTRSLVVSAAAGSPFGPWAVATWPAWMDEVIAWCDNT